MQQHMELRLKKENEERAEKLKKEAKKKEK
jgi:hypothetical protein